MDDSLALGGARRNTKILPTGELPEDIIVYILLRLPVKSLVRFRCVCKSWYSLLTSSDFSTKHLQNSRRQFYLLQVDASIEPYPRSPPIGFEWDDNPIYQFALAPDDDLDQLVYIDRPNPQISRMDDRQIKSLQVIGSVDGLVCISLNFGTYIMIWNPATRQSYQLPSPGGHVYHSALGLGRYQNNGYKVVIVSYRRSLNSLALEAEVYDSYSNMWHKVDDPPKFSFLSNASIIANGVPYWWRWYPHSIIWFDPIHDVFGTITLPVGLFELDSNDGHCVAKLGLIRGAFAVLLVKRNEDDKDDMYLGLDAWMMDQPHGDKPISWTKQFRVKSKTMPGVYPWLKCWKDGEFVFEIADVDDEVREMYLYDRFSDETKRVPGLGSGLRAPDEIFFYKESLLSPHPSC